MSGSCAYALRVAAAVCAVLVYVALAPWGYALFACISAWPVRHPNKRRKQLQAAIRLGFKATLLWAHMLRIVRVDMPKVAELSALGPCVVVANHPGHLDIVGILSWLPNAFTIVKPAIYHQPWLRPLMTGSGQLEGADTHPLEAERLIQEAVKKLHSGQNMVSFPEGTRTGVERLIPFRRLPFEIACQADVPIITLKISCHPCYLSKKRPTLLPPRRIPVFKMELLETLYPRDFAGDSRRLRDAAQALCFGN
ncbi:MAG: 1-acyl-sn-glycerol-3-phosphate acyltransferase [Myxococcales bacterium]|nr:1-acyl-sn-glycerol-3-phosphate acyltransferase [Myxococcales bacterium]